MPSADEERNFLSWVKNRFGAVTSYSEVDGDKLLFYVGQGEMSTIADRDSGESHVGMGIGRRSADFRWKKKKSAPKNERVRSNWNVIVLHQVKNWQNWKMQDCFMQFLRLIFVKKLQLQGALPPDSHQEYCPLEPLRGAFCGPQAPTFQLTFPFFIPMPGHGRNSNMNNNDDTNISGNEYDNGEDDVDNYNWITMIMTLKGTVVDF